MNVKFNDYNLQKPAGSWISVLLQRKSTYLIFLERLTHTTLSFIGASVYKLYSEVQN